MSIAQALRGVGRMLGFNVKQLVGIDTVGNKYFTWKEDREDGEIFEKREVEFTTFEYDPLAIPVEWKSWLNKTRDVPPTAEESAQIAAQRTLVKQRAAALKEEEDRKRFQRMSLNMASGAANLDRMIQQIQTSDPEYQNQERVQPKEEEKVGESKGRGDTFEPGAWRPGQ